LLTLMRTTPPSLLPILRSQAQGQLLALLYLHPDRDYSLTEAAGTLGVSVKTIHQEASRLVAAGLVSDSRRGNSRLLRAVTDSVLSRPLTDLLALTYGPLPVIGDILSDVEGIEQAFLYGSWAARYSGELGAVPNDIDVLVVGLPDPDVLDERARQAEQILGREVNIRRVRPDAWRDRKSANSFLQAIRERPLVPLVLKGKAA